MITEYQASFRPPSKYTTITFTSKLKNPYHQQRGTGADIASFRTRYFFNQQTSNSPNAGRPSVPPKNDAGNARKLAHTTVTNTLSETGYATVYQNDFQAWIPGMVQPFQPKARVSTDQRLTDTGRPSRGGKKNSAANEKREPFEGITTYRRDYVPHPVQPRRNKAFRQSRKVPPEAANQERLEFFQQFKTWSIETEDLNPPTYKEPNCQGYKKSLFTRQIYEKKTEPLQDRKALKWSCNDVSSETKTPHSKMIERAANKWCCDGPEKHQNPAGNVGFPAFKCSSSMVWSGPLMDGMSWCSLTHN